MKDHKKLFRFLLRVLALWLVWFLLYDIWLQGLDNWLTLRIAELSSSLLMLMGFKASTVGSVVLIDQEEMVYVGPACNGMILMAIFTGFVIAYPGPVLKKLLFIPLGIFIINMINVFRVAALTLNALYSAHTLELNHKYTFSIIVYASIFYLWMIWVKRYATTADYGNTESSLGKQKT